MECAVVLALIALFTQGNSRVALSHHLSNRFDTLLTVMHPPNASMTLFDMGGSEPALVHTVALTGKSQTRRKA